MNYAIILAGGCGSRFWPLSTESEPKQFLKFFSKKSLLEKTLGRINKLIDHKNIYIAASLVHKSKIKTCTDEFDIPEKNLFLELQAKNTLAPIAVLSQQIYAQDKEAVIAVLPSDHLIKGEGNFRKIFKKAVREAKKDCIVTLGIRPDSPETGYGYIKIKSAGRQANKPAVFQVERFIEKPDIDTAKKFFKDKRYYWNAGIFVFKAGILLEELAKLKPQFYKILKRIKKKKDINKVWPVLPPLSIDYGIMEKTDKTVLIPAEFSWTDLGSWLAIEKIMKKDKEGNITSGRHLDLESRNITVLSREKLVATLGLKNVIIVDSEAGLLVCSKERAQDLKRLIQGLRKKVRP